MLFKKERQDKNPVLLSIHANMCIKKGFQKEACSGILGTICLHFLYFLQCVFYHQEKKSCLLKCRSHQEGNKTKTGSLYYSSPEGTQCKRGIRFKELAHVNEPIGGRQVQTAG